MHSCIECDEVITNPICGSCLKKQFGAWLNETSPYLEKRFSKEYILNNEISSTTHCIVCGEDMDFCPFCNTKHFIGWLKSHNVSPTLLNDALLVFSARPDEEFM